MFHEFGHALNAFFADEKYPSLSGTARPRDFVEFPSQFNEHWALYPAVLKHYAFNYRTHEPMPQALIDKMESAAKFNEGYSMGESLAADELDMAWHSLPASAPLQDVDAFEAHALHASGTNFAERAAALSFNVLRAHLGERIRRRLLRVHVERNAR